MKVRELLLEKYDDTNYGYLRIHVDRKELRLAFIKPAFLLLLAAAAGLGDGALHRAGDLVGIEDDAPPI